MPTNIEADENGLDPTQAITLTYDSRINTSRILTEVNEYDKSINVLEQLIENSENEIKEQFSNTQLIFLPVMMLLNNQFQYCQLHYNMGGIPTNWRGEVI